MRVLESHIDIDATPEQVWAVLTDFAQYPEWNPFITSIEGATTPRAQLAVTIAPPGGKSVSLHPTVQTADENHRFGWLGRLGFPGVFDGAHEFILEPRANGTTSFTQRETFKGVLVPFVGKILERTHGGFEGMNVALKRRVEG